MELKNKTIIITGASSGIGAAAARLFGFEGANVVLGARRSRELEALAETINQANGKAVLLAGDVKDEDYAAEGIRINTLLPGGTITPSGGEGNPAALKFIAGLHPMKRMATPKEIAQAALFLLSDRSSFMTGSPMTVDGGMSVRLT